jgi:hypothetical protein
MQAKQENHIDTVGEQRLWTAVIARTIEDWVGGPLRMSVEADRYLFSGSADFERVCQAAGLDSVALRERLLALKKSGYGPSALMMPRTVLGGATKIVQMPLPNRAA